MVGFILFIVSLVAAVVLFSVPGVNVWSGVGFWLVAASIVGIIGGFSLMIGAAMRPTSDR